MILFFKFIRFFNEFISDILLLSNLNITNDVKLSRGNKLLILLFFKDNNCSFIYFSKGVNSCKSLIFKLSKYRFCRPFNFDITDKSIILLELKSKTLIEYLSIIGDISLILFVPKYKHITLFKLLNISIDCIKFFF